MSTEHELITTTWTIDGWKVIITQEYIEKFDCGNYRFAMFNEDGHILWAGHSSNTESRCRATVNTAKELVSTYKRWNEVTA